MTTKDSTVAGFPITEEFLRENRACEPGIRFFKEHNLEGKDCIEVCDFLRSKFRGSWCSWLICAVEKSNAPVHVLKGLSKYENFHVPDSKATYMIDVYPLNEFFCRIRN